MWRVVAVGIVLQQSLASGSCKHYKDNELNIDLKDGKVKGITLTTPSGTDIYAWRHIPYAKPPLKDLRFQPPTTPLPWTGVLDGSKDSPACLYGGTIPNTPEPTYGHSEDCLYINVYSPAKPNASFPLPVMFWIYGGGFTTGTASFNFYDPTPLVVENVIVVSFNYRLGVFGFLSTEDAVVPGNNGLKDQLAALKWTVNNIASFGGNPRDITIFGESSGGGSVGYHLLSPLSKGLFHGAILESGTCISDFLQPTPKENALSLAMAVNSSIKETSTSSDILQALQAVVADQLTTLARNYPFRSMIEPKENNPLPFASNNAMYEAFSLGDFNQVPMIIGANSAEAINQVADEETGKQTAASYDDNSTLLVPTMKLRDGVSAQTVGSEIKNAYLGDGKFVDNLGIFVNYLTDNVFRRSSIKHAMLQSNYTDVWAYQFSFVGTTSKDHPVIPGCGQVAHGDELSYLFNISTFPLETEADFLTRRRFVKLWTNFAKTKNPTPGDSILGDLSWTKFDTEKLAYLDIASDLEVKVGYGGDKTAFWDHLWEKYSSHPYNTF